MKQDSLFHKPSPVEEAIERAEARGQLVTDWQRMAMRSWEARGVRPHRDGVPSWKQDLYTDLGVAPTLCVCMDCKTPAVIFPPEEGAPNGYCICPRCSAPQQDARTA